MVAVTRDTDAKRPTQRQPDELSTLAASFQRHLAAANRSPDTRRTYGFAIAGLTAYLVEQGMPRAVAHIKREHIESYLADLLERRQPATVATYHAGLRVFFAWLLEEGETKASPMANVKTPHIPEKLAPVLSDAELVKLLKTCEGKDFRARRDMALFRLLIDTGMRRAECANLQLTDLDLDQNVAVVMGKGRRPRVCPFGRKTALALDRYLRVRTAHPAANLPALWLTKRGALYHESLHEIVRRRATEAGIAGVHPHLFRHGFAHTWLAQGGQEGDLMRLAGWRSRTMLGRYGASAASERAREAYRRMTMGDRL